MNSLTRHITLSTLALAAFTTIAAGAAHAAPLTRAQVQAELAQAQRQGAILATDDSNKTLAELNPSSFHVQTGKATKTREQVQAELAQAVRSGDLRATDESNKTLAELNPQRYPAQAAASAKSRDQVRAELAEAVRTGSIAKNSPSAL